MVAVRIITEHALNLLEIKSCKVFNLTGLNDTEFVFDIEEVDSRGRISAFVSIWVDTDDIMTRLYMDEATLDLTMGAKELLEDKLKDIIDHLSESLSLSDGRIAVKCSK